MALLAATVLSTLGFQVSQLVSERARLDEIRANQEATLEQAKAMRAQLDSIAKKTAVLAEQGNVNARKIVDQLRAQGISINPDAAPAANP
jgi:ribosomal protein L9